jgi:hypothetical protein
MRMRQRWRSSGLITDQKPDDMLVRALSEAHVELRVAEQGKAGLAA